MKEYTEKTHQELAEILISASALGRILKDDIMSLADKIIDNKEID